MAATNVNTCELLDQIQSVPTKPSLKPIQGKNFNQIKEQQSKVIQSISKAHIDSFNFMINEGLYKGLQHIRPLEFELPNGDQVKIQIINVAIYNPMVNTDAQSRIGFLYPSECRMRGTTYKGKLQMTITWSINNKVQDLIEDVVGEIPIMVKSNRCNLEKMTPKELIQHKEDEEDFGGYFICNGNEKLIRLFTADRRNYPMAIIRSGWKQGGQLFSDYGIQIRCVRDDQIGANMILHYLTNGTIRLRIFYEAQPIYLPLIMILKGLCDVTDLYIFKEIIKGEESNTFLRGCVINMLRLVQDENLFSTSQIRRYIGQRFRTLCRAPPWYTDEEVADYLFKECVAVHLKQNVDKFNLIVFMTKKLFALARGECAAEPPDSPMFHEVYLSGHVYFFFLLEKMGSFFKAVKMMIDRNLSQQEKGGQRAQLTSAILKRSLQQRYHSAIIQPMFNLISTGNLFAKGGLGLKQFTGLTISAEKINYWRFISHFRSVHRGSALADMRTTSCRKLYPEAWGFLCPVHTPDGEPCGLLNHLAEMCLITNYQSPIQSIPKILISLGMEPLNSPYTSSNICSVILDGRIIGTCDFAVAESITTELRTLKALDKEKIPPTLEIGYVPKTGTATQYPAIFLFSTPGRMMRPVFNLRTQTCELIGTFEQVYLNICIVGEERIKNVTTHQELRETNTLSILAAQIPYPDFNQSPRNMYACQMGKQTMGTASHTLRYRCDNKMYNIINPQSPLVRPTMHDHYELDNYPLGTNAVVAVISYTGYDMEDAIILNKAAVERGFKHGSIYKTDYVNLRKMADLKMGSEVVYLFGKSEPAYLSLDRDGLPFIGTKLKFGEALCCYIDLTTGLTKVETYSSTETAYVYDVKLLGSDNGKSILQEVAITLWIPRVPMIGDKFANRHGQKGVCSVLWPQENMPFTEGGMTPDILFNPHGYPSRMTIGMMIESLAGKSAAMHGTVHDATPFTFSEDNVASEYFGELLQKAGFNYFGTEKMFSGVDGRMLEAEIFIGVVYYIRLRHMVGDKYQVRSTGPIDNLTHQPIKGRKKGGGIRFGEMERDSLLAHGTSFLLQDRLLNCSDKCYSYICTQCRCILSPYAIENEGGESRQRWSCITCKSLKHVKQIVIPFVLRYLIAELAAVNIKVNFDIK